MRTDIGSHHKRAACWSCHKFTAIRSDGQFRVHTNDGKRCPGSETAPKTYYETARDLYIDPYTGQEDAGCRQRRMVEESSVLAVEGWR